MDWTKDVLTMKVLGDKEEAAKECEPEWPVRQEENPVEFGVLEAKGKLF